MITVEQIEEMDLEQLQADFFALMGGIVTAHGDDQEVEQTTVAAPEAATEELEVVNA